MRIESGGADHFEVIIVTNSENEEKMLNYSTLNTRRYIQIQFVEGDCSGRPYHIIPYLRPLSGL